MGDWPRRWLTVLDGFARRSRNLSGSAGTYRCSKTAWVRRVLHCVQRLELVSVRYRADSAGLQPNARTFVLLRPHRPLPRVRTRGMGINSTPRPVSSGYGPLSLDVTLNKLLRPGHTPLRKRCVHGKQLPSRHLVRHRDHHGLTVFSAAVILQDEGPSSTNSMHWAVKRCIGRRRGGGASPMRRGRCGRWPSSPRIGLRTGSDLTLGLAALLGGRVFVVRPDSGSGFAVEEDEKGEEVGAVAARFRLEGTTRLLGGVGGHASFPRWPGGKNPWLQPLASACLPSTRQPPPPACRDSGIPKGAPLRQHGESRRAGPQAIDLTNALGSKT